MVPQRPESVTFIAWLSIVFAIVGFIPILAILKYVSNSILIFYSIAALIQIILSVGMLKGKNWARIIFLLIIPISILIGLATKSSGIGLTIKTGFYIFCLYLLTQKRAINYFTPNKIQNENNQSEEQDDNLCYNCGSKINDEDKFCTSCGAKIK